MPTFQRLFYREPVPHLSQPNPLLWGGTFDGRGRNAISFPVEIARHFPRILLVTAFDGQPAIADFPLSRWLSRIAVTCFGR
jgi:hypothetical protein